MTRNARLNIPASVHSVVFRRIDHVIRRDPTAKRVFRTIRSWEGGASDALEFTPNGCPALRLTPGQGGDQWYGPSGFETSLLIDCEVYAAGNNVEDVMDLVQVVRLALYPIDRVAGLAIQLALKADGASETGQPLFGSPGVRVVVAADVTMMQATFQIQIDTLNTLNA